MRSSNPALKAEVFSSEGSYLRGGTMTINGTVNKTGVMGLILIASATLTWGQAAQGAMGLTMLGLVGGLITAFITIFKKTAAPVTAPIYAVMEGLFLGGISAVFESRFPGIAFQAVLLTFGVLAGLLLAYRTHMIQVTENFKLGVAAATGGIGIVYLISIIGGLFGFSIPFIHSSGMIGIGFSLVVVVVAAMNLVMDFDFIEEGARMGAPKYMEWYGAFGLMVTLVWLYIEILHLLSKLQSRD